jgi:hypothetical protein
VAVFQEAWLVVKESRTDLLQLWAGLLIALVVVNLRYWPEYERGLLTGFLLTAGIAMTLWWVWYGSGLGPRLEGTWAEDWTAEELKKTSNVLETIPNLRFERFDADNIVIARDGVYVLEIKRHRRFYPGVLEGDLAQFAKNSRTVRSFLVRAIKDTSAPLAEFITPVLVIWGKAGLDLLPTWQETATGDVVLVGGKHLRPWLESQRSGYFGPDYAHDLAEELRQVAQQREELHAPDSRLIRWFARTK